MLQNVVIREFDGSSKLELLNANLGQSGELVCVAENSEGRVETRARLTVTKKPFPPSFDQKPKNATVERDSEARFEAHALGMPEPGYQWALGGRKLRSGMDGVQIRMENGVSVLIINTTTFNTGTLSVTAENDLGLDETGALLTVKEKEPEKMEVDEPTQKRKLDTPEEEAVAPKKQEMVQPAATPRAVQ